MDAQSGRVALSTGTCRAIVTTTATRLAAAGARVAIMVQTRSDGDTRFGGGLEQTRTPDWDLASRPKGWMLGGSRSWYCSR